MNRPSPLSNGVQSSPAPPPTNLPPTNLPPTDLPLTDLEEMQTIVPEGYVCLLGKSEAMQTVRAQLRRVAAHFRMVLITGEAGTGKEIVARAMHRLSDQPEAQFVSRSAASFLSRVPEMLERANAASKLRSQIPGRIPGQIAARTEVRPTLLLGDVNALTSGEQMYLLDALTRLEAVRSGGERPRLIFATERDLRTLAGAGQFDPALYRKISAVEIALPALRSRPEDVALIAAELLGSQRLATGRRQAGAAAQQLDPTALARLQQYDWPGNVRELKRVLELAQMRAGGRAIELRCLPPLGGPAETTQRGGALRERLADVIQSHVLEVLVRCAGNKVRAAERLGISRSTLYRTLENSAAECTAAALPKRAG